MALDRSVRSARWRPRNGRQDTEASTQAQEAEAGPQAAHKRRVVAAHKRGSRTAAVAGQFRHREVALADGGRLVLHANGSITKLDASGEAMAEWSVEDPAWPQMALRLGLQPRPKTIVPEGRRVAEPRPRDG